MTKCDWAVLACKVLALWILLQNIAGLIYYLALLLDSSRDANHGRQLILSLWPVIVMGLGALLWVGAPWLARRIFPEDACGDLPSAEGEALLSVAVLAIGAWIVIAGSLEVIHAVLAELATEYRGAPTLWAQSAAGIAASAIGIAVGLWLILGNRGVIKLLQRCRTFGWRAKAEAAAAAAEQTARNEQGEQDDEGVAGR